jgi:hypothetical protein
MPPGYAPPRKNPGAGLGAASLALGLLSLLLPFAGVPFAAVGLPLGVMGKARSAGVGKANALARAGAVCSAVSLAIFAVFVLFIAYALLFSPDVLLPWLLPGI